MLSKCGCSRRLDMTKQSREKAARFASSPGRRTGGDSQIVALVGGGIFIVIVFRFLGPSSFLTV